MGDAQCAKRRRLGALKSSLPYCSQEAFVAIAQHREQLSDCTAKDLRKGRDEQTQIATPYGPLHTSLAVPLAEGAASQNVEIQNPFAILYFAVTTSAAFSEVVKQTLRVNPCSYVNPWHMIFYNDEVSPGNQLAFKNVRKLQGFYWSLLEWGAAALSNEDMWFELTFLRSTVTKTLRAGISGLIVTLVSFMFLSDTGHNFRNGVTIPLFDGTIVTLFIMFGITLADEGALHFIYESKGSAGLKCCALCCNVYDAKNERGIEETATPRGPVLHTCCEHAKLFLMTCAMHIAIVNRLISSATVLGKDMKGHTSHPTLFLNYVARYSAMRRAIRFYINTLLQRIRCNIICVRLPRTP